MKFLMLRCHLLPVYWPDAHSARKFCGVSKWSYELASSRRYLGNQCAPLLSSALLHRRLLSVHIEIGSAWPLLPLGILYRSTFISPCVVFNVTDYTKPGEQEAQSQWIFRYRTSLYIPWLKKVEETVDTVKIEALQNLVTSYSRRNPDHPHLPR